MRFTTRTLSLACLSVAALSAADNKAVFRPKPASDYSNAQKSGGLILAAEAYSTEEQTKAPFGKLNPNKHGVLPVLLVMTNESKTALRLTNMRITYIAADRQKVDSVPASEVPYLTAPSRPNMGGSPVPRIPGVRRDKKNPLAAMEIESRSFAAKLLPPGESAHGFVYFHLTHRPGSQLYITGIEEAGSGNELFYVEIPLSQ